MQLRVLLIIGCVLWVSSASFLVVSLSPGHSVFRIAALSDAIGALVVSVVAAKKWTDGN